jgi:hypothetical protein
MKPTSHLITLLSLVIGIAFHTTSSAQTAAPTQVATNTASAGFTLKPTAPGTGYNSPTTTPAQMYLRAVNNPAISPSKDSTLQLENLAGNIDIIIPRRAANIVNGSNVVVIGQTPVNAGIFSISKRINSGANTNTIGTVLPVLQISTSTTEADQLTLRTDFRLLDPASGATTTLISPNGIDTNSLMTDALYLVNPAGGGLLPVATVNNGVVTFPQNAAFPANGSLTLPASVTLGGITLGSSASSGTFQAADPTADMTATGWRAVAIGGRNGTASGTGAVVIGGGWYDNTPNNIADGENTTIIGSGASQASATFASIIGSLGSQILSNHAHGAYNSIIGGGGHLMSATAGGYNTIIAGGNNEFVSGGYSSAIIAGAFNQITNGNYYQAIIASESSSLGYARGSAIIGGYNLDIGSRVNDYSQNAIVAGRDNTVASGVVTGTVIGGWGNSITVGQSNAVIAGQNATNSGQISLVTGEGTAATGWAQFVGGRYNTQVANGAFIIGNGSNANSRSNALSLDFNGNLVAAGAVSAASVASSGVVQAGSANVTGQVQAGSVSAASATVSGQVQAGSVTTNSLIITPYASDTSDISMGSYAAP